MKKWYAKSKRPGRKQVEVKEHLCAVGELSKEYGRQLGMEKEAEMAGTVHDAGKLTDKFQDVLEGNASRVDHARVSAAFLWWLLIKTSKYAGKETKECISEKIASTNYAPILEAINAHHGTLLCYNQLKYSLLECMTTQKWLEGNEGKEVALTGEENYKALRDIFREELPDWKRIGIKNMTLGEEERMLWSRMLLSCLVDADYTASAEEDGEIIPEPPKCDAENWLERLNAHRAELARNSTADKKLNALRNELFETCGRAGDHAPGIYTLTAPTGTGKTLALLHFALRQCRKNGQQRIIIVLPFITLTEQNAIEYRKILGDDVLLEDHSQRQLTEEQRKFAQRWDMPVIVTTSVRFFEGLFAAKAPNLRKLHRLANSVIIFDEAQSLSAELFPATLKTIQALCNLPKKNVTMLFSTATQPDYQSIPNLTWHATEICPNHADMYQQLRRVQVTWRVLPNERTSWEEIAQKMAPPQRRHSRRSEKSGPAEAAKGQPMGHRTQKNLLIFGTSSVRISGSRRVFCRTAQDTHHATYHHTVYHTFPENARNMRFCTQKIGCQPRKSRGTAGLVSPSAFSAIPPQHPAGAVRRSPAQCRRTAHTAGSARCTNPGASSRA